VNQLCSALLRCQLVLALIGTCRVIEDGFLTPAVSGILSVMIIYFLVTLVACCGEHISFVWFGQGTIFSWKLINILIQQKKDVYLGDRTVF